MGNHFSYLVGRFAIFGRGAVRGGGHNVCKPFFLSKEIVLHLFDKIERYVISTFPLKNLV